MAARLVPVPFTASLLLQGLETLSLRAERHSRNALAVAGWLELQPEVSGVEHPALASSPHHRLAEKYFPRGSGSVFSFSLDGDFDSERAVIDSVELSSRMTHIGDVRSMILHPVTTSHSQLSQVECESFGIHDELVRLSVGIEDEADPIADLDRAFVSLRRSAALRLATVQPTTRHPFSAGFLDHRCVRSARWMQKCPVDATVRNPRGRPAAGAPCAAPRAAR